MDQGHNGKPVYILVNIKNGDSYYGGTILEWKVLQGLPDGAKRLEPENGFSCVTPGSICDDGAKPDSNDEESLERFDAFYKRFNQATAYASNNVFYMLNESTVILVFDEDQYLKFVYLTNSYDELRVCF